MIFKCTKCHQTLRAQESSAGKYCQCSRCQTLVKIPDPKAPRPPNRPILTEDLSPMIPRVDLATARPPDNPPPPQPKRKRKKRRYESTSESSGGSTALAAMGVVAALCILCCGGLGVLGVAMGPKSHTLSAGGYEAVAKGRRTQKRQEPGGETEGTMHPLTGSEFWIGSVRMPLGHNATLEDVRERFASFTGGDIVYVRRGSIEGLHCTGVNTSELGVLGGKNAELEVFLVSGRMLYMAYLPGSSKAVAKGRTTSTSAKAREKTFDNADAFFSSLRPKSAD